MMRQRRPVSLEGAQVTEEGTSSSVSQTIAADVISASGDREAGGVPSDEPENGDNRGAKVIRPTPAVAGVRAKGKHSDPAIGGEVCVLRTGAAGQAGPPDC